MPKYQYRCDDCGADLEVFQKFTDDALTQCPECEGRLKKVFSAVGVVFKGSGFYKTDNRSSTSKASTSKSETTSKPDKADSKPAKAESSSSGAASSSAS